MSTEPYRQPQMGAGPFVFLGILLLLGFGLPLVNAVPRPGPAGTGVQVGIEATFDNVRALSDAGMKADLKLMMVYPAVAAVAVIALGAAARGVGRAAAMIVLALFPVIMVLAGPTVGEQFRILFNRIGGTGAGAILMVIGWIGLFAGGLALRTQRTNRAAAIMAAVGGLVYLTSWFIPGRGETTIPLVAPFMALGHVKGQALGWAIFLVVCEVVKFGCMLTATIMAICYSFMKLVNRPTGMIFGLVLWHLITGCVAVSVALFAFVLVKDADVSVIAAVGLSVGTVLLKLGSWIGGLLLLLPMGIADLLLALCVNVAPPPELQTGYLPPLPTSQTERMREVTEMYNRGLISFDEYTRKRDQILTQV